MNIPKFINALLDDIDSDVKFLLDIFRSQLKDIDGKQTNSLIRLFGNKLKCRRRATSLNDINVKFQSKFSRT